MQGIYLIFAVIMTMATTAAPTNQYSYPTYNYGKGYMPPPSHDKKGYYTYPTPAPHPPPKGGCYPYCYMPPPQAYGKAYMAYDWKGYPPTTTSAPKKAYQYIQYYPVPMDYYKGPATTTSAPKKAYQYMPYYPAPMGYYKGYATTTAAPKKGGYYPYPGYPYPYPYPSMG